MSVIYIIFPNVLQCVYYIPHFVICHVTIFIDDILLYTFAIRHMGVVYTDTVHRRLHIDGNDTFPNTFVQWPSDPPPSKTRMEIYEEDICYSGKLFI